MSQRQRPDDTSLRKDRAIKAKRRAIRFRFVEDETFLSGGRGDYLVDVPGAVEPVRPLDAVGLPRNRADIQSVLSFADRRAVRFGQIDGPGHLFQGHY